MFQNFLTIEQTREMFLYVARGIVANEELLTDADKAIGDGDHGVGMTRGFRAVQEKLDGRTFENIHELLETIGITLLTTIGGAAGAIFGTFFRGGARCLDQKDKFDTSVLIDFLGNGLDAVKDRGKAEMGDKTMVDALEPAFQEAQERVSNPLPEVLLAVAESAKAGMESTKEFVAKTGKAKTLGERSIGFPDPGAVSIYLIMKFMTEYVLCNEK